MIRNERSSSPLDDWTVAHLGIVVADIDEAMARYGAALGTGWSELLSVDHDWVYGPGEHTEIRHVVGRGRWATDLPTPIELLDGKPGSPWHTESGKDRLDHVAVFADDLDVAAERLAPAGYRIEWTMPSPGPQRLHGFAYVSQPGGARIELLRAVDRPILMDWLRGAPLAIEWGTF
jgi:catechol 2,3-dioxygenase-like lactoylglutathione lyase family enzyme